MEAKLFHSVRPQPTPTFLPNKSSFLKPTVLLPSPRPRLLRAARPDSTSSSNDVNGSNTSTDGGEIDIKSTASVRTPPPSTLNIRYRSMSKRAMQRQQEEERSDGRRRGPVATPPKPKSWDEMTLGEKAVELYMGEKGVLFWLNKFAYASIFIIIGGWIAFRFVGPALNLYQLDAPPLPPTAIFKSP